MSLTYTVPCRECRKPCKVKKRNPMTLCDVCRPIVLRARKCKWQAKEKLSLLALDEPTMEIRVPWGLTVEHDPLEVGGFKSGTYFPRADCKLMIAGCAFTNGTIFRDGRGKYYKYENGQVGAM